MSASVLSAGILNEATSPILRVSSGGSRVTRERGGITGATELLPQPALAPTSTAKRQTSVARLSRGFIYYVSLTGITGAKLTDKADVEKKVREIRRYTKTPVAVGFGIATPEDARAVARIADGVIVGSALVKIIAEGNHAAVANRLGSFTRSLKAATLPA